jgi:hypothetical protein
MFDTILAPGLLRVIHPLDDAPEQKLYHRAAHVASLSARCGCVGGWRVLSGM